MRMSNQLKPKHSQDQGGFREGVGVVTGRGWGRYNWEVSDKMSKISEKKYFNYNFRQDFMFRVITVSTQAERNKNIALIL